jgi:hypothetical protein
MSPFIPVVVLVLLLVFVPISLLPLMSNPQDNDSLIEIRE